MLPAGIFDITALGLRIAEVRLSPAATVGPLLTAIAGLSGSVPDGESARICMVLPFRRAVGLPGLYVWGVPLDSKGATIHSDQKEGNRVAGDPSSPSSIGEAHTSIANSSGWPVPTTKKPRRPEGDSPTVGEVTSSRGAKESV